MEIGEQKMSNISVAEMLLLKYKLEVPARGSTRTLQSNHLIWLLPVMNSNIFDCAREMHLDENISRGSSESKPLTDKPQYISNKYSLSALSMHSYNCYGHFVIGNRFKGSYFILLGFEYLKHQKRCPESYQWFLYLRFMFLRVISNSFLVNVQGSFPWNVLSGCRNQRERELENYISFQALN